MIERAREEFKKVASEGEKSGHEIIPPVFLHCAAQDLITQPQNTKDAKELSGDMCSPRETELDEKLRQLELLDPKTGEGRVDLVLFHAVIEWAADPFASLNALLIHFEPYLSRYYKFLPQKRLRLQFRY